MLSTFLEGRWVALMFGFVPLIIIVADGKASPVTSPLVKRHEEDTIVVVDIAGLFLEFWGPER